MLSHFGLTLIAAPTYAEPKIKLGANAPVSETFRTEFDAWLLQMFGTRETCIVPPGTVYIINNKLIMQPGDIARLINYGG